MTRLYVCSNKPPEKIIEVFNNAARELKNMSNTGVHDFAIPHGHVKPTRDMVLVRLPLPPKMVGSIQVPEVYRDMAMHNVMVGRVVAMGPLAFVYKDAEGASVGSP